MLKIFREITARLHGGRNEDNDLNNYLETVHSQRFSMIDDKERGLIIYNDLRGIAKFLNPKKVKCVIGSFDVFLTAIETNNGMQPGTLGKRCDFFLMTERCFLLWEIKDREVRNGGATNIRQRGKSQLGDTLTLLSNLPSWKRISNKIIKKCILFNSFAFCYSDQDINKLVYPFNRLDQIIGIDWYHQSENYIEGLWFEYWEYSGAQIYSIS